LCLKLSGKLLAKEKEATRARDALAAERRRLPMVQIDKDYVVEGPDGKMSLLDLFAGRRQLILYHFMFAPEVDGWPEAGCVGCSSFADNVGHLAHLHARGTSLVLVSRAPLANIERYKKRMGRTLPWVSSFGSDFNVDFGLTTKEGEDHGLSVFLRDGDSVYRTYFASRRGCEMLGSTGPSWTWHHSADRRPRKIRPLGGRKLPRMSGGVATTTTRSPARKSSISPTCC
jgi:predicted dithiol-disulfide oxidoreductase (DUF899 family)